MPSQTRIAVLIPCYNEEHTISVVTRDFRAALPGAEVYVYDNLSTDGTRRRAESAGAIVRTERRRGKGRVVCRMFADIDADIYVLVDGDGTYDAAAAPALVEALCSEQLDMVNGARVPAGDAALGRGRYFGNLLLTGIASGIFGERFSDMLSGYKVFSRRFVKSFATRARGFEIETALTIHALDLAMPVREIPTRYSERPKGSSSKLHPLRDGIRILLALVRMVAEERPMQLFGAAALLLAAISAAAAYPVVTAYLHRGFVWRFPRAILSASLLLLAEISVACGLIVDVMRRGRREAKRLRYLALPAPPAMPFVAAYPPVAAGRLGIVHGSERRNP